MNEIEINNIQNVAQNMIVGSKQHTLFDAVRNNNPNLVTTNESTTPEYGEMEPAGERGLEISKVSIDKGDGKPFTAIAVSGSARSGCCGDSGGMGVGMGGNLTGGIVAAAPKGLNNQLYGMLKPCDKQFNASSTGMGMGGGMSEGEFDENN